MRQNLFYIPNEIFQPQVLGFSWLLLAWTVFSVALLVWLVRKQGFTADTWGYVGLLAVVAAAIRFLLPHVCQPQGFPIRGFGVMLLVAVVAAVAMAAWRGRRLGIDPEVIFTLSFWAFVPGIIGARAFYVIEYWPDFDKETLPATLAAIINVTEGGLVVYGSVLGGMLGLAAFLYKYKMPPLATLDLITPSFVLGIAIGRLGCLLNGCCYGGVCDLPWAVTFPAGSPPYLHQVGHGEMFVEGLKIRGPADAEPVITEVEPGSKAEQAGLKAGQKIAAVNGRIVRTVHQAQWELVRAQQDGRQIAVTLAGSGEVARWPAANPPPRSKPAHPTQLYSSINALVMCLLLLAYAPFRRRDGEVWTLFLTLYPITRFLLEIIRTDEPGVFGTGLTISQNISLVLLLCAAVLWAYVLTRPPGTIFPTYREQAAKP